MRNNGPPPSSLEAEQALLGAALRDESCAKALVKRVRDDEMFIDERNILVYEAIRRTLSEGKPAELAVVDIGQKHPSIIQYLGILDAACHSIANFEAWLDEAWNFYESRTRLEGLDEALRLARGGVKWSVISKGLRSLLDAPTGSPALSIRSPSEILGMHFDDSDRILGDRLLAKGQPLTIVGPGGLGKSRLLLQLAACCITGLPFLGFETRGQGLRWLVFQAENSTRRLQSDLQAMASGENWCRTDGLLFIHTLETEEDSFLSLASPENEARIAQAIARTNPDIIAFDPLNAFAIGDLNSDVDMAATCRAISKLAKAGNPERAIIVIHHAITGKAGAAKSVGYDRTSFGRNSKVLHSWTRGQINVAPGSPDNNETLVLSCGKCSNGKEFERFAARLNTQTMIYELDGSFDFDSWQSDVSGVKREASVTVDLVAEICKGALTKRNLVKAVMDETGCAKSLAYRKIDAAVLSKRIHLSKLNGTYVRA